MRADRDLHPLGLGQDGPGTLVIDWSDGHRCSLDVRALRLACPCAECVDEWTGEQRLREDAVPDNVRPVRIDPVGQYALTVAWTDGHTTGIYTFERLAEMCACEDDQSGGAA